MSESSSTRPVVLITGGGKGIGRGISEVFLAANYEVVICGRGEPDPLPEVAGRKVDFIAADVKKSEQITAMFEQIEQRYGRLDVLVNNAGGSPFADAATASPRFHEAIIRLNLLAPFEIAQQANALMQKQESGGSIVFVGSVSGLRPSPGTAAYGAAKAGVLNLVTTLAVEWAPKVRTTAVSPGLVLTEQAEMHYGDEAGIASVSQTVPMQRMANPQEIGEACLWLASDKAGYASGTNLVLHGGGEKPAFLDKASVNKDD